TGRMEILIRDLLDVSSIEAGRLSISTRAEPVGPMLDAVEEMLRPQAGGRGVTPEVRRMGALVEADYDRIVQVLAHLGGDALAVPREGGRVMLAAEPEDAAVRFTVEDNGCGIPKEHQELLFEPFGRGDQGDGAGLGLAIAHGIVVAHGGGIGVDSEVGRGTRMEFRLPCPLAAAAS